MAVVTSEETGIISVAVEGTLKRGITDSELREVLSQYLLTGNGKPKNPWGRNRKTKYGADKPKDETRLAAPEGEEQENA